MFDIGWSELLIIGIITLLLVGPKELPVFLRTIGRYVRVIRQQAAEFRSQFDEAIRDSELDTLRKDVAGLRDDVTSTVRQAARSVESELSDTKKALDDTARSATKEADTKEAQPAPTTAERLATDPDLTDENGLPLEPAPKPAPATLAAASASPSAGTVSPAAAPATSQPASPAPAQATAQAPATSPGPAPAMNGPGNGYHDQRLNGEVKVSTAPASAAKESATTGAGRSDT